MFVIAIISSLGNIINKEGKIIFLFFSMKDIFELGYYKTFIIYIIYLLIMNYFIDISNITNILLNLIVK